MDKLYFYHSFPQGGDNDLGLRILESILKSGLLLTAEEIQATKTFNQPDPVTILQKRACFTAIPTCDLKRHSETFGRYSIEFECQSLRDFGVMPVFYFAGPRADGTLLNGVGGGVLRNIAAAHDAMLKLVEASKNEDANVKAVATKILTDSGHNLQAPEEMHFSLQTLLNLSYSTDTNDGDELEYFKEREWRIVPNPTLAGGDWLYPTPNEEQRAALIKVNKDYFDSLVCGKPMLSHCSYFQRIGKQNLHSRIHRIIVPPEVLDKARALALQYGFAADKAVSSDEREFRREGK